MSQRGASPLARLRAWWAEQTRPSRCRECDAELTPGEDSGFCCDEHYVDFQQRCTP